MLVTIKYTWGEKRAFLQKKNQKKPNTLMGKTKQKNYTELYLGDHLGMHINPSHTKERWNYRSKPNYVFVLK